MLDEARPAVQPLHPLQRRATAYPCLVHAKSDAEVIGVGPALEHPNVTLLHERRGGRGSRPTPPAARSPGSSSSATASGRPYSADIVVVSCGAANSAKLLLRVGQRHAPRTGWPTAPTRSAATTCSTTARRCSRSRRSANPTRLPEDARRSTTSTSATDDFDFPMGNIQMVGKSQAPMLPRREAACETKLAPDWTPRARWRGTRSTSGSRPRTCRMPDNRVTLDGDGNITLAYTPTNDGAARAALPTSCKSMLGHARHAPRPPARTSNAYIEERASRSPASRTRPAPAASAPTRRRRCSTSNCKAHELDNLYVVDTSFFPSIGAVNPALTAMANALRVGDHLLERLGVAPRLDGVPIARSTSQRRLRRRARPGDGARSPSRRPAPSSPSPTSTTSRATALRRDVPAPGGHGDRRVAAGRRRWRAAWARSACYLRGPGREPRRHGAAARERARGRRAAVGVPDAARRRQRSPGHRLRADGAVAQHLRRGVPPGPRSTGRSSSSTRCSALGTALAPVFVAIFVGLGFWWGLPVLLGAPAGRAARCSACACRCDSAGGRQPTARGRTDGRGRASRGASGSSPASPLLYGICETMNGNWARLDMTDAGSGRPPRWRRWR